VSGPADLDAVGLCLACRWMRVVTNRRGSRFFRCTRADTDVRFARYPALPVLHCIGYEPAAPSPSPPTPDDGAAGPAGPHRPA
jgi:hypothetical protein